MRARRGRRSVFPGRDSVKICLTLADCEYDRLDALARRYNITLPELIRTVIRGNLADAALADVLNEAWLLESLDNRDRFVLVEKIQ